MLTALVVHKHGDMQPGPGFFELAQALGKDTSDILKFWIEEVKRVFAGWKRYREDV
jgi:molybdopterin synthase catalytic subunit